MQQYNCFLNGVDATVDNAAQILPQINRFHGTGTTDKATSTTASPTPAAAYDSVQQCRVGNRHIADAGWIDDHTVHHSIGITETAVLQFQRHGFAVDGNLSMLGVGVPALGRGVFVPRQTLRQRFRKVDNDRRRVTRVWNGQLETDQSYRELKPNGR